MQQLDFPVWLRVEHWLNVLFLTLLIRSGIEIIATHPKLYWRNDSRPGTEWARFTRKRMPKDKLYDTLDEEESYASIVSLPGHKQLGMGRHWHFVSVIGWILTGLVYVVLLFATGQWLRYVPTSWSVFPTAWDDLMTYLSFDLPPLLPGQPLDALQKLAYAGVIFLLAPFQILTGAAQSPAVEARFPRYVRLFGGRQAARSLHFLGLVAFLVFLAVHLTMIISWGWPELNALMIFGEVRDLNAALWLSLGILPASSWSTPARPSSASAARAGCSRGWAGS
ncbi:cytochrome b/b6 domain-containing protein [Streptomyces diacarni]|uniref:cytochrome b/b6 domain-containing protein n=1 Tax=Streptomyces diacarni TaxID=2800381 RepID=UPI001C688455|nr:cytochrome b/b6 domain-containing protein [Streptomyces diacarni]